MTLEEKKAKAEELLMTPINWYTEDRGTLQCPGASLHTKHTGEKDTILYLDGVPTLFCYHESCREDVELANKLVRMELAPRSPEEKREALLKSDVLKKRSGQATMVRAKLDLYLNQYAWELFPIDKSFETFLSMMWAPSDVIWVGDVYDTGPIRGPGHFRRVEDWLSGKVNLYGCNYTTASTFKPKSIDRVLGQVETTPYVVIEFDKLHPDPEENKRQGAALLNYLRQTVLDLVAVVDSGNKSLHGWAKNNARMDDETRYFLRTLGADTKTMRPSQPVRVAGAKRENGKTQSLLWTNH